MKRNCIEQRSTAEAQRAQRRIKEKTKSKGRKPYALCPLSPFLSYLCVLCDSAVKYLIAMFHKWDTP